jgi:hypothetical protein
MAANPQIVTANTTITYDGVTVPLMRGQVIDMPASGALATALSGKVVAMTAQQQVPGSSDSISSFGQLSSQLAGGGNDPYNAHQAG